MFLLYVFHVYLCSMKSTMKELEEIAKKALLRQRELENCIVVLKKEVSSLRERLARYEKPIKDSQNSSIPPSTGKRRGSTKW